MRDVNNRYGVVQRMISPIKTTTVLWGVWLAAWLLAALVCVEPGNGCRFADH
jgi:hypothetical protein